MKLRTALAAGCTTLVLGASVLLSASASAAPAPVSYGFFTCSDGTSAEIFGKDTAHFPINVGFIDAKGVVARWVNEIVTGTFTVVSAPDPGLIGDVLPVSTDNSGPATNSRRTSPPKLDGLAACSKTEAVVDQGTLTAEDVVYFGLDPMYVGATVDVELDDTLTVWINSRQLAAR